MGKRSQQRAQNDRQDQDLSVRLSEILHGAIKEKLHIPGKYISLLALIALKAGVLKIRRMFL